jgi:adenylosuccinate synthase
MTVPRIGVQVLVDGQFGSTGKGLFASYWASKYAGVFDMVVTNAGPNSGHTSYYGDVKIVLKQLPTFGVTSWLMGHDIPIFISPGAIIDFDILNKEVEHFDVKVLLSAQAAVISDADKDAEHSGSIAQVAGTRQGVGAALARKVSRDPTAVVSGYNGPIHKNISITESVPDYAKKRVFMEVSQGF